MTPESRSEMLTDDIEPIARAIWEAAIATRTWAIADDKDRALCRHVARAAVAADPVRQALVEELKYALDLLETFGVVINRAEAALQRAGETP